MSEETVADLDVNSAILSIEKGADGFAAGLRARFSALSDLPGELANLRSSMVGASSSPVLLSLAIVLVVVLTAGTFLVLALQVNKWTATSAGWRRFGLSAAAMGVALTVGLVAARMLAPPALPLRTLRLWVVATVVVFVVLYLTRLILTASRRPEVRGRSFHVLALSRDLSIAIGWAIVGVALVTTLQIWDAGRASGI